MTNDKLNGSVDLLAKSLRDVFVEAAISVGNDIKADMKDMEGRLNTTNSNMAVMFTNEAKRMGDMIDAKLQKMSE